MTVTAPVVAPPAPAAPVATIATTSSGLTAHFDGSGSTGLGDAAIDSYSWAFGDGETGEGVTTDHTYAKAGEYVATLTITSGDASVSPQRPVTVSADADTSDPVSDPGTGAGTGAGSGSGTSDPGTPVVTPIIPVVAPAPFAPVTADAAPAAAAKQLAFTGSDDTQSGGILAILLLVAGCALVAVRRFRGRRSASSPPIGSPARH
ncbi:PKD domain-containing protein [Frondihabitans australicus]|uniref:PKD domain-containing protein n=1 Tax=Frondihabitans australicus TaxID=386892 RepID=UPI0014751F87|nr:PKD domain-containing protein [Frondihabitans australicus]